MPDRRQYAFDGRFPTIDDDAHVSHEATLVGEVKIAAGASVWPGVVLRGDIGPVRIGQEAHIGDTAMIHASTVGDRVMIGHGAVLNEATVEADTIVGFNVSITADVTIGENSLIAAGSVLPEGEDVPPDSFVRGVPAQITPLAETDIDVEAIFDTYSSGDYTDLARRHDDLFE